MDIPCQISDVKILKKMENDVEVMLMLQNATISVERNQSFPSHEHKGTDIEDPQENKNMIVKHGEQISNGDYSEVQYNMPHSGVIIKLDYSPPKCKHNGNKIKGTTYCLKHSRSIMPNKSHSQVGCAFKQDFKTKGNNQCMIQEKHKTLQELKYVKGKLEKTEEALKSEMTAKLMANDAVINIRDKYERLNKDVNKFKRSFSDINKLKEDNNDLKHRLESHEKEKTELLVLVETREENIRQLKKTLYKFECENKIMHEEGENKLQALFCENVKLTNKIKELDMMLAHIQDEVNQKEKIFQNELSRRLTSEEVEANKAILEEKCKKHEQLISEKEALLKEANKKNEKLEVKLNMAKEASNRSLLSEEELKNSNTTLEEKLNKIEKEKKELECELFFVRKNLEEKLNVLEKEKEAALMELNETMEKQNKHISELSATNKKLQESLMAQSVSIQKKENQVAALRERSVDLTDQLEALQNSISNNGSRIYKEASQQTINTSTEREDSLRLNSTEKELEKTRETLELERKEVSRRDRIITQYEETINKMKEEENKRMEALEKQLREKERSERDMRTSFSQERRQNEILLDELTQLRWQERELTEQLNETMAQLDIYEKESAQAEEECLEHSRKLQQIEDEVEMKTVEWYSYINKLTQERDTAVNAARFATQKLKSSVSEFQRHITIQKKVQQMLTRLLYSRESEFRAVVRKASKSTYRPYVTLRRRLSQKRMMNAYRSNGNIPSFT